jgi:undecaprenyl-diphosphatase
MEQWTSLQLKNMRSQEFTLLLTLLIVLLAIWGLLELSDQVLEGEMLTYDERLMLAAQQLYSESPHAFSEAMRDITSLGSTSVLIIIVTCVSGFLALQKKYRFSLLSLITSGSGVLLMVLLKNLFDRQRPDIIPHMVEVTTQSYPSGHTMMSAVVYLTLATMVAFLQQKKRTKIYSISMALLVTFLVGFSRIYLGVHYPSDVFAGWAFGLAWASFCWLVVKLTGWLDLAPVKKETKSSG